MNVMKITNGFVKQTFDSETGKCISQEFIAGDSEYECGDDIVDAPSNEIYQPFEMVQPST